MVVWRTSICRHYYILKLISIEEQMKLNTMKLMKTTEWGKIKNTPSLAFMAWLVYTSFKASNFRLYYNAPQVIAVAWEVLIVYL
jgi:hypothetical protein